MEKVCWKVSLAVVSVFPQGAKFAHPRAGLSEWVCEKLGNGKEFEYWFHQKLVKAIGNEKARLHYRNFHANGSGGFPPSLKKYC